MSAILDEEYVTVAEAAALLAVSQSTIRRWIDQGSVRAYRVGLRRVRLKRQELSEMITPARESGEKGAPMVEKERERLGRPLTRAEQKKALDALEAAERFAAVLRQRRDGQMFPDSAGTIRELREQRTQELP
jgi:excisionase family DNA binding protein